MEKYADEQRILYLLFFFDCDSSYDILCSNSTLLPPHFDASKAKIPEYVSMKPDITGKLVAKSPNLKDMEIYKKRLEQKLNESHISQDESFGFLDLSQSKGACSANDIEDSDTEDKDSVHSERASAEILDITNGKPTGENGTTPSMGSVAMQLEKLLSIQKKIF